MNIDLTYQDSSHKILLYSISIVSIPSIYFLLVNVLQKKEKKKRRKREEKKEKEKRREREYS